MKQRIISLRITAALTAIMLVITAMTLTTATFAWFSMSASTNVEPMEGSVGPGEANVLICASEGGSYDKTCQITRLDKCTEMLPVSTLDLKTWYTATGANKDEIAVFYRDITEELDTWLVHGEVYVKAEYADADLYFSKANMNIEGNAQLLASLRLAMRITGAGEEKTYFFKLDDIAATGGAAEKITAPGGGESVVSAVSATGTATFSPEPTEDIAPYLAVEAGPDDEHPQAGNKPLCSLTQEQPAKIEFWFYMEGCDNNCINEAQENDLSFLLAFAGVPQEQA